MPSRNARHGHPNTWGGIINIKNAKYERDERPIDPACGCPVCRNYSRAYIRHPFKAEELLRRVWLSCTTSGLQSPGWMHPR